MSFLPRKTDAPVPRRDVPAPSWGQQLAFLATAAVFSVILSVLFSGYSRVSIPSYAVGDIARVNVVVPSDIVIRDEQATEARRAAAEADALPVYRYDPSYGSALLTKSNRMFEACRRILEPGIAADARLRYRSLPQNLRAAIQAEMSNLAPDPPEKLEELFVDQHFSEGLESTLTALYRQALALMAVEDERSLIATQGKIEVLDTESRTDRIVPLDRVFTLEQARARAVAVFRQGLTEPAWAGQMAGDWLSKSLAANLRFDLQVTELRRNQAADAVDPVLRQLKRGKIIVRQGDEIGPDQLSQIDAVRKLTPSAFSLNRLVGSSLLIIPLLYVFELFLRSSPVPQFGRVKLLSLSFLVLAVNLILVRVFWFVSVSLSRNFVASPFDDEKFFLYALPFAFGPMLVTLLAGDRIAQIFLIFYLPLAAQTAGAGFQDLLYILGSSLIGIMVVRHATQRVAVVVAGFKLSAAAAGLFVVAQLAQHSPLTWTTGTFGAGLAFLSGPINASLLTFVLPVCERLFMVTTEIRLSELSNLNLPLVRNLILRAPGTYNHSVAAGTLAEGAAKAIGLNPLFVRVACLYHDIGKSLHPRFFVENQGENGNPHDQLAPSESVRVIKQHIDEGIRLGRSARLPPAIVDVIPQHHGKRLLTYFYDKAKRLAGDDASKAREEEFRYGGPKPQTKEAAVIMLADAVEAAARTLPNHSQENLLELIRRLVSAVVEDGQFAECDITLAELDQITFSFLETLSSIYHSRVTYPGFDFRPSEALPPPKPATAPR